jgi:hypothetical protein
VSITVIAINAHSGRNSDSKCCNIVGKSPNSAQKKGCMKHEPFSINRLHSKLNLSTHKLAY